MFLTKTLSTNHSGIYVWSISEDMRKGTLLYKLAPISLIDKAPEAPCPRFVTIQHNVVKSTWIG